MSLQLHGPRAASVRFRFVRSFVLVAWLLCGLAWAQQSPARLETIVVTGTRTPTRIDHSLAEVTLIGRAQIEQSSGRTLAELLAQQPGIQFTSNGGAGKVSAIFMRGLEARHTLLLIDGVRYGSATVGTPILENIPLDAIERIEIVRGPLSGLYGSDAVAGVVQIFTRSGAPGLRLDGSAGIGSNHQRQLGGGVRFGEGAWDGAAQLAHTETGGFSSTNAKVPFGNFDPDDDLFRQDSGSARLGWRFADGWRADASLLHSDGITEFDDGVGADSRAGLRTEVLALQVGGAVTPLWRTNLRTARSTDEFETIATASAFTPLGTIGSVQQQLTWENTLATPLGAVVLLADHLKQKVSRPGAPFAVTERSINGVAAGFNGRVEPHTWQANLRHDRNSQFGSQTTGSVGYGFDFASAWRAGASYGTSFVAPSFNQLYFPAFGNPDLQPEEGKHGEVSLRWAVAAGQQLRLAYFDNRIRGFIPSGPAPTNIPRTRIDGVSLSYEAALAGWTVAASADHVDPRNETEGSPNFGKQLPRRARNSARLAADTTFGEWRAGGTLGAFSERFDDTANSTRVGGFATLDLRADWSLAKQWTLGLRLNNVTDKSYETVFGFNQPGREAYVTVRYSGQ